MKLYTVLYNLTYHSPTQNFWLFPGNQEKWIQHAILWQPKFVDSWWRKKLGFNWFSNHAVRFSLIVFKRLKMREITNTIFKHISLWLVLLSLFGSSYKTLRWQNIVVLPMKLICLQIVNFLGWIRVFEYFMVGEWISIFIS